MHTTDILLRLALASAAVASPLAKRIDKGAQSCTCQSRGVYGTYSVNIGTTYDASRCDGLYDSFKSNLWNTLGLAPQTNWQCEDDGSGNFQLWFDVVIETTKNIAVGDKVINPTLDAYFTDINGFNCPNY